jgi:hypothetical protein
MGAIAFAVTATWGSFTEGRGAVVGQGASTPGQLDVGYLDGGGAGSRRFISGYRRLIAELAAASGDRRRRIIADDDASSLTDLDLARAA